MCPWANPPGCPPRRATVRQPGGAVGTSRARASSRWYGPAAGTGPGQGKGTWSGVSATQVTPCRELFPARVARSRRQADRTLRTGPVPVRWPCTGPARTAPRPGRGQAGLDALLAPQQFLPSCAQRLRDSWRTAGENGARRTCWWTTGQKGRTVVGPPRRRAAGGVPATVARTRRAGDPPRARALGTASGHRPMGRRTAKRECVVPVAQESAASCRTEGPITASCLSGRAAPIASFPSVTVRNACGTAGGSAKAKSKNM